MKGTAGLTVLAPIAWGTTYAVTTELLPSDRPLFVALVRVVPAGLALVLVGAVVGRRQGWGWRPHGAEWRRWSLLAVCNFGCFFPLLFLAVDRLPGGLAAAVGGLQPLLVVALSWLVAGRRPRSIEVVLGLVAVAGVAMVVVRPGADVDAVGVLAAAGANLSFALGVVLTKRFPAPANRLAATGWQLLLGGVVIAPLAIVVDGAPPTITAGSALGFAYLSLIGTALAYVLWFGGIRRLPTQAPPLLGLAAPVTGAAVGWVVLGQSLSALQLTGFVLILGAIARGALLPSSFSASSVPHAARITPGTATGWFSARRPAPPTRADSEVEPTDAFPGAHRFNLGGSNLSPGELMSGGARLGGTSRTSSGSTRCRCLS